MNGTQLLIVAVIVMFVIAFVITMVVLNTHAKKIIDTNSKLVENQNAILEQNKVQENELEKRINQLEEQLKHSDVDEVMLLQKPMMS